MRYYRIWYTERVGKRHLVTRVFSTKRSAESCCGRMRKQAAPGTCFTFAKIELWDGESKLLREWMNSSGFLNGWKEVTKLDEPRPMCGACARVGTNDFSVKAHAPGCDFDDR